MAYYRDEDERRPQKRYPTNRDDDRRGYERPYRPRNGDGYRSGDRRDGYRGRDDRRGGNGRGRDDDRRKRSDRPWVDVVALEARVRALEKAVGIEPPEPVGKPEKSEGGSEALLIEAVKRLYAAAVDGDADAAEEVADSLEENGIRIRDEPSSDGDERSETPSGGSAPGPFSQCLPATGIGRLAPVV